MRKGSCLLTIVLLSSSFLAMLPQGQATAWIVPDDYPTIQAAVDAADPGDTIEVRPDVYREDVYIATPLTIIGQDKSTTIVDGSEGGYAFWLDTGGVTIRGFTICNSSNQGVMGSFSGGHTIEDNIFVNNAYGVYLTDTPSASTVMNNIFLSNSLCGINVAASNDNTISGNYISGSTYGIRLSRGSELNSIMNNIIVEASHGIYMSFSANNDIDQNSISGEITGIALFNSPYTEIRNNTLSGCAYGIEIYNSMYTISLGNTATRNGYGVYLVYASGNTVNSNLLSNNGWGMVLFDSDNNIITENTFSFNAYGIDITSYSTGNTIAWNNVLNNTMQVHQDSTSGGNTWNKQTGGETYGSYWSNYTGEDTNNPPDGVGDTLLPHLGVEYYPLINPWSTVHDLAVINVLESDNTVYQGQMVSVTVVLRNEGTVSESFNVTAKYFNRPIGTQKITNLARLETITLIFYWNTTSVPPGFAYEITADAEPIAGETDKLDNTYVDGNVHVKMLGDIDGDNYVGSIDASILNGAYGTSEGDPFYVQEADFDDDDYIGSSDAGILNGNYGKTC